MLFKIYRVVRTHSPGGPVVKTSPSAAGGVVSIPGWIPESPYVLWPKNQNIKQRQYCNKLNKEFKNGLQGSGWGIHVNPWLIHVNV